MRNKILDPCVLRTENQLITHLKDLHTMRYLLLFIGFLLITQSASAQDEFGIGIIVGEPTGITAKQWLSKQHAIDAGVAWSFSHDTTIQIHGDYLYHRVYFFNADDYNGRIPVYFGIGGRTILSDEAQVGVRFPVGIGRTLKEYPMEFFFELVPILDVAPDTDFDFNAAIGFRYYLNQ